MNQPHGAYRVSSLKRASLLFGSQEVLSRVTTIGLSLFAARSLGPAEVGGLGLAVIVSSLISMVASCPESAAVFLDRSYGTGAAAAEGARMRLLITAVLVAPVLIWAEPVVVFLNGHQNGRLALLVRLMLLVPCLEALAAGPSVRAQRALDLSYLGRIQLGNVLAYVTLAFAALGAGLGVVGMVAAQVLATAGMTISLWRSGRERWAAAEDRVGVTVGPEVRRGAWRLFVGGFGGFLGARLDSVLVARSLGAVGLGLYSTAWSASRLCAMVVARAMNSTLGPILPQIGVESDAAAQVLKRTYVHFILLASAASSALIVWTPALLPRLLGERWLPAIPVVQLTSVSALCAPVVMVAGLMLNVSGSAHKIAMGTAAHLGVLAGLVPLLAPAFGVVGGALGEVAASAALTIVLLRVLRTSRLSTAWIDQRATLWSLAGLASSVGGTVFFNHGSTATAIGIARPMACTAIFFLVAAQYGPFRELLCGLLNRRSWAGSDSQATIS